MIWNIADAKSKFSEVINTAIEEPQVIYNRKKPTVVVLNFEEFNRLKKLDVLVHKASKWAKFVVFSNSLALEESFLELPSRSDRDLTL